MRRTPRRTVARIMQQRGVRPVFGFPPSRLRPARHCRPITGAWGGRCFPETCIRRWPQG